MANDPHWIEHAHLKKGALTKKAKAAGESVGTFAKGHAGEDSKTGHQASAALALRALSKRANR